jgi:hypothetical protein
MRQGKPELKRASRARFLEWGRPLMSDFHSADDGSALSGTRDAS